MASTVNRSGPWPSRLGAFLVVVLAAFQLTRWLVVERGPYRLLERTRERLGRRTEAVFCPFCVGFWATLVALALGCCRLGRALRELLALVALQTLLQQLSQRLDTYQVSSTVYVDKVEREVGKAVAEALRTLDQNVWTTMRREGLR